jgi:predicted MFS family arabinose efflux permease
VTAPVEHPHLSRGLILVMATACGIGVANTYFPQAITPLLATHLQVSRGSAALVATTAQLGYAVGIFFLVPLGDRLSRRPLITVMFTVVAIGLFLAGTTSSISALYVYSAIIGAATVVAQVLIPMAADLARGENPGRVVATLQGGLVGGILLARAFGGGLGQWLGWRAPYLVAGGISIALVVVLAVALPHTHAPSSQRYSQLVGDSVRLFREFSDLRRSVLYQALIFAGFSAAWTSIALYLTGPHYGYGTGIVGLVALVGAGSVFSVPFAGRAIDRHGPDALSALCMVGVVVSAALMVTGFIGGIAGLLGLIVSMLVLDVSVQSSQVANQARIFQLKPDARSRLNSAYMTCVFLGDSVGSLVGARLYVMGAVALTRHVLRSAGPMPVESPAVTG